RTVTDALSFRVDVEDFSSLALRRLELACLTVVVEIGAALDIAGLDSGHDDDVLADSGGRGLLEIGKQITGLTVRPPRRFGLTVHPRVTDLFHPVGRAGSRLRTRCLDEAVELIDLALRGSGGGLGL